MARMFSRLGLPIYAFGLICFVSIVDFSFAFASDNAAEGGDSPKGEISINPMTVTAPVMLSRCLKVIPVKPQPWIAINNVCNYPVSGQFKFHPNHVKTYSFAVNHEREGHFSRESFVFVNQINYNQPKTASDARFIEFKYPDGEPGNYRIDVMNHSKVYVDIKFTYPAVFPPGAIGEAHIIAAPGLNTRIGLTPEKKQEAITWAETEAY